METFFQFFSYFSDPFVTYYVLTSLIEFIIDNSGIFRTFQSSLERYFLKCIYITLQIFCSEEPCLFFSQSLFYKKACIFCGKLTMTWRWGLLFSVYWKWSLLFISTEWEINLPGKQFDLPQTFYTCSGYKISFSSDSRFFTKIHFMRENSIWMDKKKFRKPSN